MKTNMINIRSSQTKLVPIFWDGKDKQLSYDINLLKPGASVSVLGLLLGNNENELEIKINITHNAPDTKSEVILKGALCDCSKVNFEGLVKIEKGAKKTNTWLAAHLLILSNQARGRAIPSLEILENDIKAGHATTVGKVNDLELFYLQSRGLSQQKAKKLIVNGFLSSILQKLPENIRKEAAKRIENFQSFED